MISREQVKKAIENFRQELIKHEFAKADRLALTSQHEAAEVHQRALIMTFWLDPAATAEVLKVINVRTDFNRDTAGRIVSICAETVSSDGQRTRQTLALSDLLTERLQRHIEVHRPELAAGSTDLLFMTGPGHKTARCKKRVRKRTPRSR